MVEGDKKYELELVGGYVFLTKVTPDFIASEISAGNVSLPFPTGDEKIKWRHVFLSHIIQMRET